jgi:hypothetical protein
VNRGESLLDVLLLIREQLHGERAKQRVGVQISTVALGATVLYSTVLKLYNTVEYNSASLGSVWARTFGSHDFACLAPCLLCYLVDLVMTQGELRVRHLLTSTLVPGNCQVGPFHTNIRCFHYFLILNPHQLLSDDAIAVPVS